MPADFTLKVTLPRTFVGGLAAERIPAAASKGTPLEVFGEGLALFRGAGLGWFEAYDAARQARL